MCDLSFATHLQVLQQVCNSRSFKSFVARFMRLEGILEGNKEYTLLAAARTGQLCGAPAAALNCDCRPFMRPPMPLVEKIVTFKAEASARDRAVTLPCHYVTGESVPVTRSLHIDNG